MKMKMTRLRRWSGMAKDGAGCEFPYTCHERRELGWPDDTVSRIYSGMGIDAATLDELKAKVAII
jgi:hypothetical protein